MRWAIFPRYNRRHRHRSLASFFDAAQAGPAPAVSGFHRNTIRHTY